MKKLLLCLVLTTLALSQTVLAQTYLPFPDNYRNYYFISNDSIFSMKVASIPTSGTTKTFIANQVVKKGRIRTGNANCIGTNTAYHEQPNNQFGERIWVEPNGDCRFLVKHGTFGQEQTFLLKTKVPLNHSWQINAAANLWATYSGKALINFGGISDSVKFFNLSDGKRIVLSKNYGLFECPNFTGYVAGSDFPKRQLQIYKLPDLSHIDAISDPLKVFDFQPNDKFSYYTIASDLNFGTCEAWDQIKILTRLNSPGGDSIYYTLERQRYVKSQGFNCILNKSNILTPVVENLIIHRNYYPETNCQTNELRQGSPYYNTNNRSMVSTAITRSAQFNQRELLLYRDLSNNPSQPNPACGNIFTHYFDLERRINFGTGIGKTYEWILDLNFLSIETLEAYVKGTETYGTWRSIGQIMAEANAQEPAAIKAYPNPFTSEISLQCNSTFSSGKASVLVSNVLGQEVLKQEITVLSGQENRLDLGKLPKGIYVLKAEQNGKSFTTRLVKE